MRELTPVFSRRQVLRAGVVGSAMLAVAPLLLRAAPAVGAPALVAGVDYRFLRPGDVRVLRAIIPVILANPSPQTAVDDVLAACDRCLARLPSADRHQLRRLFDLLNVGPARVVLAGIWGGWEEASADAIRHFLDSWRRSRVTLFHSGYQVLRDLVMSGWYGDAASWSAIGYPGPPDITIN